MHAIEILEKAIELGITTIDTAPVYSSGMPNGSLVYLSKVSENLRLNFFLNLTFQLVLKIPHGFLHHRESNPTLRW
ncbi:MAG: aldo/keto reductase [Chitinispirillaceae bacterium]|nr:aldo/keto reductase [Chitinispirillaceae bacterium]